MIKNIVLDFGQVLVKYDFAYYLKDSFGSEQKVNSFISTVLNEQTISKIDRELVPLDQILEDMKSEFPEYTKEIDLFGKPVRDYVVGEIPGMRQVLENLKSQGYRLFGLSNWCHMVYKTMPKYEIFKYLEGFVISSDEKVVKPESEIYRRFLSKFDLVADECVFVDDKQINIDGAKSCGMHGIVFKNAEQFVQDLNNLVDTL